MVENYQINRRSRWLGVLCTLFISSIVFMILFLILLRTPIPPYPEGGGGVGNGIELNLGFSTTGSENYSQAQATPPEAKSNLIKNNDKILTQDIEDAPSINDKVVKTKNTKKSNPREIAVTTRKTINKESPKPQQTVDPKAMYHPMKNQAGNNGTGNVSGIQGDPNGNLGAKAFGGPNGQGGVGGGTGGGAGTGTGPNTGGGISYNLAGRNFLSLPKPEYNQQTEGIVVVEVTVDKDGTVTQAIAGVKGSTTLDDDLLSSAKNAALKAKFDKNPNAPAYQKGSITYRFRLQ